MIDWREMPAAGPGWPFDDRPVLLLVANMVGIPWREGGQQLDPAQRWYVYVATWDRDSSRWATTETDEETNGTRYLSSDEPTRWSELNLPY